MKSKNDKKIILKKCVQIQLGLAKKNHAQMINILPNRIAEKWACG